MALFVGQKRQKTQAAKAKNGVSGPPVVEKVHKGKKSSSKNFRNFPLREDASSSTSSEEVQDEETSSKYNVLLTSLYNNSAVSQLPAKRRKISAEKSVSLPISRASPGLLENDPISGLISDSGSDESDIDDENEASEQEDDPFQVMFEDTQAGTERSKALASPMRYKLDATLKSEDWSCTLRSIEGAQRMRPGLSKSENLKVDLKHVKKKLREAAHKELVGLDDCKKLFYESLYHYQDTLFSLRNPGNADALRNLACIHALNHIFKTRDRILRNNSRQATATNTDDNECRDQGFTRPKVIILIPTRQACVRYVNALMALSMAEQQENKKRFLETFSSEATPFSHEKPEDFRELFDGNDDDLFRIGIKFTRKTVKLFSGFYKSDVILGSPLGLRMAIENSASKQKDHDFLSSIELMMIDQADALLMQNWEHVEFIVNHLNLQPRESHGCDFSRVRNWYLDGKAKYFRQTVAFSAFNFPALNKLFASTVSNIAGKATFSGHGPGVLANLRILPPQTFSRLAFQESSAEPDARFEYFLQAIIPMLSKASQTIHRSPGVLIFLPSYAEFLRVRNHLTAAPERHDIAFGGISEYTSAKDTSRARSHFLSGRYSMLLYTERAHHFRRYLIRGVRKIVFYGLPENPSFYQEILEGFVGSSLATGKLKLKEAQTRVIFSRLDLFKLERVVGSQRCLSMLQKDGGDTFDFT